jgi:hypothetical protein
MDDVSMFLKPLRLTTLSVLIAFLLVTAHGLTVCGVLEAPSVSVDHFEAGAGSTGLMVRAILATLAAFSLVMWALPRQAVFNRIAKFVAISFVFALFWHSALGIQRFAPNYNEKRFWDLVSQHHAGQPIHSSDLLYAVGEPLAKESFATGTGASEVWLYSYMPSSGFGWEKRVAYLDLAGNVVGFNTTTEP